MKISSLKVLITGVSLVFLSACVSTPASITFEQQNTNFTQVAQNPESFDGNQVRWGGIVARVENLEKDTLIEIVNLPLDSKARPVATKQTGGRFIARLQGFYDPLIYKQGKEITVVGVLGQPMPGTIGKHPVNFPVVDTSGHELWEERQHYQHISVYSAWDPFWFYRSPYRWHYPYYRYPHYRYPNHGIRHHHHGGSRSDRDRGESSPEVRHTPVVNPNTDNRDIYPGNEPRIEKATPKRSSSSVVRRSTPSKPQVRQTVRQKSSYKPSKVKSRSSSKKTKSK